MFELLALTVLCGAVSYFWRGLGVLLSGHISTNSDVFVWVTCVTYAMMAGLIMRIVVMPSGLLATSLLAHRLLACAVGLAAYYLARGNLFVAVGAGAVALTAFNYFRPFTG